MFFLHETSMERFQKWLLDIQANKIYSESLEKPIAKTTVQKDKNWHDKVWSCLCNFQYTIWFSYFLLVFNLIPSVDSILDDGGFYSWKNNEIKIGEENLSLEILCE